MRRSVYATSPYIGELRFLSAWPIVRLGVRHPVSRPGYAPGRPSALVHVGKAVFLLLSPR